MLRNLGQRLSVCGDPDLDFEPGVETLRLKSCYLNLPAAAPAQAPIGQGAQYRRAYPFFPGPTAWAWQSSHARALPSAPTLNRRFLGVAEDASASLPFARLEANRRRIRHAPLERAPLQTLTGARMPSFPSPIGAPCPCLRGERKRGTLPEKTTKATTCPHRSQKRKGAASSSTLERRTEPAETNPEPSGLQSTTHGIPSGPKIPPSQTISKHTRGLFLARRSSRPTEAQMEAERGALKRQISPSGHPET